jgi:hypothetical protein
MKLTQLRNNMNHYVKLDIYITTDLFPQHKCNKHKWNKLQSKNLTKYTIICFLIVNGTEIQIIALDVTILFWLNFVQLLSPDKHLHHNTTPQIF